MCECGSSRTMTLNGKVSDMFSMHIPHMSVDHNGYVPWGFSVGNGDYLRMNICMDCGRIQNFKPLTDDTVRELLED